MNLNLDIALENLDKSIKMLFPNHMIMNESLASLESTSLDNDQIKGILNKSIMNVKKSLNTKNPSLVENFTYLNNKDQWFLKESQKINNIDSHIKNFYNECYEELKDFAIKFISFAKLSFGLPLVFSFSTITDHIDIGDNKVKQSMKNELIIEPHVFQPSLALKYMCAVTMLPNGHLINIQFPINKSIAGGNKELLKTITTINLLAEETINRMYKKSMIALAGINTCKKNPKNKNSKIAEEYYDDACGINACIRTSFDENNEMKYKDFDIKQYDLDILREYTLAELIDDEQMFYLLKNFIYDQGYYSSSIINKYISLSN